VPYSDWEELQELLSRDDDSRPGTAGSLPQETLEEAIESADAVIDGRLGSMYTVPFGDPPPKLVTKISLAIAAYEADLTFREVRDYSSELNPVYLRYKDAMALLTELQQGKSVLPDYTPPDPDPGPDDNPNDSGSIVDVINPAHCPIYPGYRPDISTPEFWSQAW
jgi:phage gp36-like protein